MDQCDAARTSLSKIGSHPVLELVERDALAFAIKFLGKFLPYVRKIRDDEPDRNVSDQKFHELHKIIVSLGQILGRLESQNFEV